MKNCLGGDNVLRDYMLKCRKSHSNYNRQKVLFFNVFAIACFISTWWIVITDSSKVFPCFKNCRQRWLFVMYFSFVGFCVVKLYYYYKNSTMLRLKFEIKKKTDDEASGTEDFPHNKKCI